MEKSYQLIIVGIAAFVLTGTLAWANGNLGNLNGNANADSTFENLILYVGGYVSADWVNISEFTMRNAAIINFGAGITVQSYYNAIARCTCYYNYLYGIYLKDSSNNVLVNCTCHNNSWSAIPLINSSNNELTNCICRNEAIFFPSNNFRKVTFGYPSNRPKEMLTKQPRYIQGYAYYGDTSDPAEGANVTIINENISEKLYTTTDSYGYYQINVGHPGPNWPVGSMITVIINGTGNYSGWTGMGSAILEPMVSIVDDIILYAIPPEISNITDYPDPQYAGGYINITCDVTDNVAVDEVWVNITYPGSTTHNFSMNPGSYYFNQTYSILGTYDYFIWANDTSGNANMSALHQFNITSFLPVANFTWTPAGPTQEDMVQFTDLSTGTIVNWTWSFGDGYFSYEQNSTHRFTIGNIYTVNLTVKDNNGFNDSIEKNVIVDRNVSFLPGYNYFGYSLWNDTNSSVLAGLLNLQIFDTIYRYNTSAGYFTGYTVGIGDPDVFNISTWDALIIKVGGGKSSRLNTTNKVNSSRNVSLTTTDGNPGYNYLCWSSYNSTNATEFATLAGLEAFDTIYKYNTTSSSFIGYTVGIGDPDVFDIEPYDVIIVKVASNKEFVIP